MSPPRPARRHRLTRLATSTLLALTALWFPVHAADAFCPTKGLRCVLGATGMTHQDLTEEALEDICEDLLGTSQQTTSMRQAIKEIWQANADVDDDQAQGMLHFDAETFASGKQRLITLLQGTRASLQANDAQGARRQLGQALHAIQDFYAHANWVEAGHSGATPALWRPGEALPAAAAPGTPTCEPCTPVLLANGSLFYDCSDNLVTTLLTSGYYGSGNEDPQIATKCRHGGPFDTGAGPKGGINKDSFSQSLSPHHVLHAEAADDALEATRQFVLDLQAELTPAQFNLLLGIGTTVAVALDTTAPMASALASVRGQLHRLVEERRGTDQEPLRYLLVPFDDHGAGPATETTDPAAFLGALDALDTLHARDALRSAATPDALRPGPPPSALRTGTTSSITAAPGRAMAGALRALDLPDTAVDLFLIARIDTGAPEGLTAHAGTPDEDLAAHVSALAQSKAWKIHAALITALPSTALPSTALPAAYAHLTAATGGHLFHLTDRDLPRLASLLDATLQPDTVDLVALTDTLGGKKTIPVPVDTTLSRVTFTVSGSPSLRLTRPDGSPLSERDPSVQRVALSTGILITVRDPEPGLWTASIAPSGAHRFHVRGTSPVAFDHFDIVDVAGRPGHHGYFARQGLPVRAADLTAAARISGGVASAHLELRTEAGALLQTLTLTPDGAPGEIFGAFHAPSTPFVVHARGTLVSGEPFRRVLPRRIHPQPLRLSTAPSQTLAPGSRATVTFTVENTAARATLRPVITDDRGFVVPISHAPLALGPGETETLTVELDIPADATPGASDTVRLTLESPDDPDLIDFATATLVVASSP
ncbi:HET-C-related protein [Chondromyces apiculatus]|uniref:VWFA domain-containing protein n=1 Tax=Chondromyces apiculatus DSM 436 TaxID=1192034 RepID=A0A017STG2_9BACT|nr:HET-C-related protein [Chondromyces apiculatus]EYF00264.1 Hypothetical protein CAP_0993 [Chondromyces apiculatus DSM 436]